MVRREEYQKTGESVKNEGMMDGLDSWGTDGEKPSQWNSQVSWCIQGCWPFKKLYQIRPYQIRQSPCGTGCRQTLRCTCEYPLRKSRCRYAFGSLYRLPRRDAELRSRWIHHPILSRNSQPNRACSSSSQQIRGLPIMLGPADGVFSIGADAQRFSIKAHLLPECEDWHFFGA